MGDINTVGVIGAGQMGSGIAHVCALGGREVRLHDMSAERLQAARLKNGQVSLSYAGASAPVIRTVGLNTLAAR